jgi:hypothetical protein
VLAQVPALVSDGAGLDALVLEDGPRPEHIIETKTCSRWAWGALFQEGGAAGAV